MKKYLFVATCLLMSGAVLSQDKYSVPVPACDQKHAVALTELYLFMGAGINFAKSQGISPYDYGKYVGRQIDADQSPDNFDLFVKWVAGHMEMTRIPSDPPVQVKENPDGSVNIITDEKIWLRYFGETGKITPMKDFNSFMEGVYLTSATRAGVSLSLGVKNGYRVYTLKRMK